MSLFRSLSVIGPGLIGSSVMRRAKETGLIADTLIAADINPAVLKRVEELGFADRVTSDMMEAAQADCVMICVPVGSVETVARAILPYMKPGSILTDVASVRGTLGPVIQSLLPDGVAYVPGHPMAGTEHSGPDAGFSTLFEERWCLLVPPSNARDEDVEKLRKLWELCGAQIKILPDDKHDRICAMVSHLPHLLAFTICDTADHLSEELQASVLDYAASGFRDFSRIAASDPVMWRDIFLANKDALLTTLDRFVADTQAMAQAIRDGDEDGITRRIERGRAVRRTLIETHQA